MDFDARNRRGPPRFSCKATARIRAQSLDLPCNVVDISATGAKITLDPNLATTFREVQWGLSIERIGYLSVRKVWQRSTEFGLVFVHAPGMQSVLEGKLAELEKDGIITPLEG